MFQSVRPLSRMFFVTEQAGKWCNGRYLDSRSPPDELAGDCTGTTNLKEKLSEPLPERPTTDDQLAATSPRASRVVHQAVDFAAGDTDWCPSLTCHVPAAGDLIDRMAFAFGPSARRG